MKGSCTSGTGLVGAGRTGVLASGSTAVRGAGSLTGLGGDFSGGHAPIRLRPGITIGPPTTGTHNQGELYVDVLGSLYICMATGAPGTWKQVTVH